MKFKVGDEVIYTSGRHGSDATNPLHENYPEVTGVIIEDERYGALNFRVEWSNGQKNIYAEKDLDFYSKFIAHKEKLNI